ncbi:hypothetical protein [Burkholderia phage vB_BglM_WTB]
MSLTLNIKEPQRLTMPFGEVPFGRPFLYTGSLYIKINDKAAHMVATGNHETTAEPFSDLTTVIVIDHIEVRPKYIK